jgi:acetyltransferase-like isoleucine patch superfamily enzyme
MTSNRSLENDWFPSVVPEDVTIGDRSWLYSSWAFVQYAGERELKIGDDTGIYLASIFDVGPNGDVQIGDFVSIDSAVISTNHKVSIGSYTLISFSVVIADSAVAVPWSSRRSLKEEGVSSDRDIVIGENVWIGARSIILGGARLGEGAIVGAFSVVDFEVPPFSIVAGNPARVVGTSAPRG